MIFCRSCGYEGVYEGPTCPACHAAFSLTKDEIEKMEEQCRAALRDGLHESARELSHILADQGVPSAAAAYGRFLSEEGNSALALQYLAMAAEGGDAKGAYSYGKLLKARGDISARFFLIYSALLGYSEAYEAAASVFFEIGRGKEGEAYLSLAAACTSRSAALSLARRYEKGDGVLKDVALAKWYLSFVSPLPPKAWLLAFRLRRVAAKEPPAPSVENVGALISELMGEAERRGYKKIYLTLCQMLATRGSASAQCRLGILYAQGYLGAADPEKAKEVLLHYGKKGNAEAYLALGDMYRTGSGQAVSRAAASTCYRAAKELGSAEAAVRLGDLYAEGEDAPNASYAHSLYKEATKLGSREGADKARAIEEEREHLYTAGKEMLTVDPEGAYSNFARAASMGYVPAAVALGLCYEEGLGVRRERRRAFLWYESAVKQKDPMAEYRLGRCYYLGLGINRDFEKAHKLLRHSASLGVEEARILLFELLERRKKKMLRALYSMGMRLFYQGKNDAAYRVIEKASSMGVAKATYILGCFYEFGIGTKVDRDLAYITYRKAGEEGFFDARSEQKSLLLRMMHMQKGKRPAALL